MRAVLYIFCGTVSILLQAFQLLLLARALMSWFPVNEDGKIYSFIFSITEPVMNPVRAFLDKFEFFRNMPIDLSFIVLYIVVSIVILLLPSVV